jgi:sugar O-acyltransferase (sialic acid O-acetyltransferase NeuD family)
LELIIFGAGGQGKVILDIFKSNDIKITGFLDSIKTKHNTTFQNYPILGDIQYCHSNKSILGKEFSGIVAIGDNLKRKEILQGLKEIGMTPINAIHPSAIIAKDVEIGIGNMIAAGVVINPGTSIGDNVILNTSSSIDHDNTLENHTQICPGANLAGEVTVRESAFIGTGAIVNPGVSIGKDSIIGSGSVVITDIPDNVLAVGNPAKIIKKTSVS